MANKWTPWGKYALVLTDAVGDKIPLQKGYSISKALIKGKWIYEAWELPKQIKLGTFNNANDAKLCVDAIKNKSALPDGAA